MMPDSSRKPGWDKQAVNRVANEHYGSLQEMFDAHGWDSNGRTIGQTAPTLVMQTYGNVEAFVQAHEGGLNKSALNNPFAAIESDPPNVWLTSFYGFAPRNWGFLGFTTEIMRNSFVRRSKAGALVVVYAASGAGAATRGKVIGIQQVSHRVGHASDFMNEDSWRDKQANLDRRDKWNFAVQAVRAWKVTPETSPSVADFAPHTYSPGRSQVIGAQGMLLEAVEANNILGLDLVEVSVFGGPAIDLAVAAPAKLALKPSRPGPVSQTSYTVREAEGPKHLYVLELQGDADAYLGRDSAGQKIVKIGFSKSPETRCSDHNRAFPAGAFRWSVLKSTFQEQREAFPSSKHAMAGEQEMKDQLEFNGQSLGGEFFLANRKAIELAWQAGIKASESWKQ
jgi:hypothetical protein